MVFPVATYGCESWTVKKAEHQKIDAFKLWCWRRLLKFPWTARRAKQSILREIKLWCSLEGLVLKLKFPVIWSSDAHRKLIGIVPDAGKDWGQKEKRVSEDEKARGYYQCNEHELGQTLGDGEGGDQTFCSPWGHKELDMTGWLIKQASKSVSPILFLIGSVISIFTLSVLWELCQFYWPFQRT